MQAHKWFSIAGANGNENGRKDRDTITKRVTPAQIAKAQKRACEWLAKHGEKLPVMARRKGDARQLDLFVAFVDDVPLRDERE